MTPKTLSEYFIAFANSTGDLLTNLKIQKLVFYTQAWHLAFFKEPLFAEDFEAWIHGPVLPVLYDEYRKFSSGPVMLDLGEDKLIEMEKSMDCRVKEIINDIILKYYYNLSSYELELSTRQEEPWQKARNNCPIDESCKSVIKKEDMQTYYEKHIAER